MLSITSLKIDGQSILHKEACPVAGSAPVFSWAATSNIANDKQTAFQLIISRQGIPLWDSGLISTSAQRFTCPELALPEGVLFSVSLSIKNTINDLACVNGEFYLATTVWRSAWICDPKDEYGCVTCFRREFEIAKPLAEACLYAAAAGYQRLSMDGELLRDVRLDPAHTDYSVACEYVVVPGISLAEGRHCLGAMLAQGWRRNSAVTVKRTGRQVDLAGAPAFSAMLRLLYEDGTVDWIFTDDTWLCGHGAYQAADLFDGVIYDASRTAIGWDLPGFVGFSPAALSDFQTTRMDPMLIPPIVEQEIVRPIAFWRLDEDTEIVDFGRNLAGVVRLCLPKMNSGARIELRHAEVTDETGDLYLEPLRGARAEDIYIASGDEKDLSEFCPDFTYHGFRYVRIRGYGQSLTREEICAVTLRTNIDCKSSFRCGSPIANAIHEALLHTEQANIHSILTDCPNRNERQGWMNDATVRFEEMPYNFDVQRMFAKVVRDIADAQGKEGEITCTAPFVYGKRPGDPVCSSYLIAAQQVWLHYGDLSIISDHYDDFCAWENYLLSRSDNWIVQYSHYGDWAAPEYACVQDGGVCARSSVTPGIFMSTGYSLLNCRMLAEFARLLGKDNDALRHEANAEAIANAMRFTWYNAETKQFATGSHACQTFALYLDLFPAQDAPAAAEALRDALVACDDRITTGNLCTRYLFDVLTRYGYLDDAWRLFTREEYPSIGYMLQQEATTIWERFELKKDPYMNSHNHPMFGAVDFWLWKSIVGIRPMKPGYELIKIAPHLSEKLLSVQATAHTVMGDITLRIVHRYGAKHLMLTIPFGAQAVVEFGGKTHEIGSGYHVFSEAD